MFEFRDREMAAKIIDKLRSMDLNIKLMHVCGTHQDTLVRYGLQEMLEDVGVNVRQGPGCPVCVTTPKEIEEALALARAGKTVAIFGDLLKVPSETGSLLTAKSEGADVRLVYSIADAVELADQTDKEVVFIAVGFETTAPSTAAVLLAQPPGNFSVLSCHRTIPNALRILVESGKVELNGLIEPGHVSVITGWKMYEFLSKDHGIPQVVAGFEPLDFLMGIYMVAHQIKNGEAKVDNAYERAVTYEGNLKAQEAMRRVFEPCDVKWRGFPVLPGTGLKIRNEYEQLDARLRYRDILEPVWQKEFEEPPGCKCGDVLRGELEPTDCPLFAKACTPSSPVGPCMVSHEGGCTIAFKYQRQ
ncbi:MAG: hydrogenase formation protein HypD [Candidatus Proteinoplasmatales archaeon SG8-5]|nr:MAG: hydrogenase formation protein HypD [Candidatus Proteinoplasmatales archaeon SG8-5]